MKTIPSYCRDCGNKLVVGKVDADKIKIHYEDSMGGRMFRLDAPFDEKTGLKNEAETRTCPNWKHRWIGSEHDKIVIYKDDLHYL